HNPKATKEEVGKAYEAYNDFYVKFHQDHPNATTDCYEEFLETLGKQ
ncbi:1962_t:CDS:1, partial [Paraglomus occultum]